MQHSATARILMIGAILSTLALPGHALVSAQAPTAQAASRSERTVWYFYRVKWGFQDEFVRLFRKNHYPVLKEEMKSGRLKDVRTFVPTYHGDGRADWTFAVVITYRDAAAMTGPSNDAEIINGFIRTQRHSRVRNSGGSRFSTRTGMSR